ncbi:angiotensin-converting enzyme-like [Diadema setosum]|uniref:angiotensin-converting enzyme-like n=1 Tax=Diadema setosum TaxID=31175 RepID=UPI003B3AAF32
MGGGGTGGGTGGTGGSFTRGGGGTGGTGGSFMGGGGTGGGTGGSGGSFMGGGGTGGGTGGTGGSFTRGGGGTGGTGGTGGSFMGGGGTGGGSGGSGGTFMGGGGGTGGSGGSFMGGGGTGGGTGGSGGSFMGGGGTGRGPGGGGFMTGGGGSGGSGGSGTFDTGTPIGGSTPQEFLTRYDEAASETIPDLQRKKWNYYTDATEGNRQSLLNSQQQAGQLASNARMTAQEQRNSPAARNAPQATRRQMEELASPSRAPRFSRAGAEAENVKSRMKQRYLSSKLCDDNRGGSRQNCRGLNPDLQRVMKRSKNKQELTDTWKGWRDAAGAPNRDDYRQYVDLSNQVAKENGFRDNGDRTRRGSGVDNLKREAADMYNEMRPVYQNMHSFVRRKLYDKYGPDVIDPQGPIPADRLGTMTGQDWGNIYDVAKPFKERGGGADGFLQREGYDTPRMYQAAEDMYTSMGFDELPDTYWSNSQLGNPDDGKDRLCDRPTSYDFKDGQNYRGQSCQDDVSMDTVADAVDLLGQTYYQREFADQPMALRDPASPALFKAIAGVPAIPVYQPGYQKQLGRRISDSDERNEVINGQMREALNVIPAMPYSMASDDWRSGVFDGSVGPDKYTEKWWDKRQEYEGLTPPVLRSEADFDPGVNYNILNDEPSANDVLGTTMKYQIFKSLCDESGHEGPLHECNLYGNEEAGKKLRDAMKMGKSKPWPEVLRNLTGESRPNPAGFKEYFKPLNDYMRDENRRLGNRPGWTRPPVMRRPGPDDPDPLRDANSKLSWS